MAGARTSGRTLGKIRRRWVVPGALFLCTVVTTLWAGAERANDAPEFASLQTALSSPASFAHHLSTGAPFAAALLAIFVAHEFGHFFFARRHGVDATFPYFIPLPTLIGTMGAVIRLRGRVPSRTALVDVAVAGPLAGLVVAIPLLVLGLGWSTFEPWPPGPPPPQTLAGIARALASDVPFAGASGLLVANESLLARAIRLVTLGPVPAGHFVALHPVAWAAVFGLFVTALNLIPVGQLDGGHALYALVGERARVVGRGVVVVLVVLGVWAWPGWLVWAFVAGRMLGTVHPNVTCPNEPLPVGRRVWAAFVLALLPLILAPLPVEVR